MTRFSPAEYLLKIDLWETRMNNYLFGVVIAVGLGFSNSGWSEPQSTQAEERWVISGSLVYDKAFDLTWQRCAVGQKFFGKSCAGGGLAMPLSEAEKYSKDGWRLPTHRELLSLLKLDSKPFIDEKAFPSFACCYYWTSEYNDEREAYYYVLFDRGESSWRDKSSYHYVRLVRSSKQF